MSEFYTHDKNVNDQSSFLFFRRACNSDRHALIKFYSAVFGDTENVAEAYANIALYAGVTYVFDISNSTAVIVSALTVIPTINGEKYAVFGATLPSLRGRGIFSDLLRYVIIQEQEKNGESKLIFLSPTEKNRVYLKKRGFVHESYALECFLKGNIRKKAKLIRGVYGGSTYHFLRCKHLGDDGLSESAFSLIYSYYLAKGNYLSITGDGYIAFSQNEEEKGKYIIDECSLTVKSLLSLPPAFEKCYLPIQSESEIIKSGIIYNLTCTAVANFQISNRYINGLLR